MFNILTGRHAGRLRKKYIVRILGDISLYYNNNMVKTVKSKLGSAP